MTLRVAHLDFIYRDAHTEWSMLIIVVILVSEVHTAHHDLDTVEKIESQA